MSFFGNVSQIVLRAAIASSSLLAFASTGCALNAGTSGTGGGASEMRGAATERTVVINGQTANHGELARLESALRVSVPAGEYWHDKRSGLAGPKGGYSRVFAPGFDFGEVAPNASSGTTGAFYNGRELPIEEARVVAYLYGIPESMIPAFAGRYILESTGDLFRESDGAYLGNLVALARAKAKTSSGGAGDGFSCSGHGANGPTCSGSSDGCTAVTIPSSTPSPTGVPSRIDVAAGPGC